MLASIKAKVERNLCGLLNKANKAESMGGYSASLDNEIKRYSVINRHYKDWSRDQIVALDCFLSKRS